MSKLSEICDLRMVTPPEADCFNGTTSYSDIVGLKYYDHVTFVIMIGDVTSSGTATVTVQKCTDNAGTGATAMAFTRRENDWRQDLGALTATASTGFATSTTSDYMHVIEIDAAELGDGYDYVRLKFVEGTAQAVDAAVLAILSKCSAEGATVPNSMS